MNDETHRMLLALLVCTLAGFCTLFGALIVFFKNVKKTNERVLALGNAFAAGVMLFVALCEIVQVKSYDSFMEYFNKHKMKSLAVCYSLFFIGVALCCLLNLGVHYVIDSFNLRILSFEKTEAPSHNADTLEVGESTPSTSQHDLDGKKLILMSMDMFIALTLHNLPEGIATYIATYQDKNVGIILAVAISAHNVPEGLAVALPVYYATGRKMYAFLFAFLASIAEPIGGIIGLIVIKISGKTQNHLFEGISFGIVGGIMLWVVVYEMLPISFKYEKSPFLVSVSFFLGAMLMALSLVLMQ